MVIIARYIDLEAELKISTPSMLIKIVRKLMIFLKL